MNAQNASPPRLDLPKANAADCQRRVNCKDLFLPRGKGKTTRMMSLAELCDVPIICASENHRRHILSECRRWHFKIPAVYTAADFVKGRVIGLQWKEYIVDDADEVLRELILGLTGGRGRVIASSTTYEGGDDRFA